MKLPPLLLAVLLFTVSLASFASASEPNWQALIGNSINNLAGTNSSNLTCPFLGNDPNCGNYIVGAMFFVIYVALALFTGIPSEVSLPMGLLLLALLSTWGWLPGYLFWAVGALGGVTFFLILYRFIGG